MQLATLPRIVVAAGLAKRPSSNWPMLSGGAAVSVHYRYFGTGTVMKASLKKKQRVKSLTFALQELSKCWVSACPITVKQRLMDTWRRTDIDLPWERLDKVMRWKLWNKIKRLVAVNYQSFLPKELQQAGLLIYRYWNLNRSIWIKRLDIGFVMLPLSFYVSRSLEWFRFQVHE